MNISKEEFLIREEKIRILEKKLNQEDLLSFRLKITASVKDPDTYSVLVYVLGLGFHHLYLKQYFFFLLDFTTSIIFWISLYNLIFMDEPLLYDIFIFAGLYNVVDFLYCLLNSQYIVDIENLKRSEKLISNYNEQTVT